jgi:RND family efflux transporter MFP subunit
MAGSLVHSIHPLRAAVFCSLLLLSAGCGAKQGSRAPDVARVVATIPVRKPIVEWDEYVGRIDSIEKVEVRARVSGHLESTHFVEGQIVKKGDLLCILDQRPFRIAIEQAEADLARTEAQAREADARLSQAEAEVRSAKAQLDLARANVKRGEELLPSGGISKEERDVRQATSKQSQADYDTKVARVALSRAAVTTATADIKAAKSQLANARLNFDYTEVKAPVNGRVSNRMVTDGNLIRGGIDQATVLTTIVSLDPIHCYFDVDEQAFLKYLRLVQQRKLSDPRKAKLPILIGLADEERGFAHQGHLDFLDNRMDRGTDTMRCRAILPNADLFLTPGMFAKVHIPGSQRHDAVLIPDSAVGTDQAEKYVMVIESDNKVRRQKVEIGRRAQGLRIVRGGLDGGEKIVLRGLQRVRPGGLVEATVEETVAISDGLPDDARPLPEERWIPSYSRGAIATDAQPDKLERTAKASAGDRASNGRTPEGMP